VSIWVEAAAKIAFTLFCLATLWWWLEVAGEPVQIGAAVTIFCIITGWVAYPVLFGERER
jgi:hypothetical protein